MGQLATSEMVALHQAFTMDVRTGRVPNPVWHHWANDSEGMERLCDQWGEMDGIGPTHKTTVDRDRATICNECISVLVAEQMRGRECRFDRDVMIELMTATPLSLKGRL